MTRRPLPFRRARFRFYAELNDFLPSDLRGTEIERAFDVPGSVKDMIEALGVPHAEVDLVVANGKSVDFSYLVSDGDRISVYPVFESIDISPVIRLRPEPLRVPRFAVDVNLGRLARYLRMIGFDALYRNDVADRDLVEVSEAEKRLLLTRDVGVLKRSAVTRGYFVRSVDPRSQFAEVLDRFDLWDAADPFSRCMECNGVLEPVDKAEVEERLPARTRAELDDYKRCRDCGRIYWQGSHHGRMQELIEEVKRRR